MNGLNAADADAGGGAREQIAEDERFVSAKRNEMFVMMQYFGYLRRDPDASWLRILAEQAEPV